MIYEIEQEIIRINKAFDFNDRYRVRFMVKKGTVTIVSKDGFYSNICVKTMNELGYELTAFVVDKDEHYAQFSRWNNADA